MNLRYRFVLCFVATALQSVLAQDSVDVTFRYSRAGATGVTLVGEFNAWSTSSWPMSAQGNNLWTRTARLRIGGNPTPLSAGVPGAWQYKFYYSGVGEWPNDPLDHHVNPADNNNSFLITKDPTIYQFLPNQRQPVVTTATPTITAYVFAMVGAAVDTASLQLQIDGITQEHLGGYYDTTMHEFSYTWPTVLENGSHIAILFAGSTAGGTNSDTVIFTTQAGHVQITTHGGYSTWNALRPLRGIVQGSGVTDVKIVRNGIDTSLVPVTAGAFAYTDTLTEGVNVFRALADSSGATAVSSPVSFTYLVNHAPTAQISFTGGSGGMLMLAAGSTDPDSGQTATLSYLWSEDPSNPAVIGGVNGATSSVVNITIPSRPGEYYIGLIARDADGNADTTRNYFIVNADGGASSPSLNNNPSWAREGRIYFLFPKAFSQAGTISEAAKRLQYIKDMGFSIIWMTPVMDNAAPIDNGYNPGYNIVDFYNVAPEYGTNQDFQSFVTQAHALGLKVILDVTPNHTSRFHPWSQDAHQFKQDSRYWSWFEHAMITANTNGLGDCLDADGFNYYCGFSDQLLNFNWKDVDARTEMINVYKYWIKAFGIDGYRFDVYWGPHRRYGEAYMGQPVRAALKHIKPDILLLGEDNGTGAGSETIYADYTNGSVTGGLDAAYDFKLYFNQIRGFGFSAAAIDALHAEIDNSGYYPGKNALYMRFMESQDEDRIVYFYSNNFSIDATTTFMRTMPMATVLFTIPGIPMLWNGQEVGWGYGIGGSKEARNRSVINWDYQGKTLLTPHYQKLALIRGQFPAFTQHKRDTNLDGAVNASDSSDFVRCGSTNSLVYAFTRPFSDQNGLTVVNLSGAEQTALVDLTVPQALAFSGGIQAGKAYYLNDLYTNTSTQVSGSGLASVGVTLAPYGSAVYTVSTTHDTLLLTNPILSISQNAAQPLTYALEQNYPNPFNPFTVLTYTIGGASHVRMVVYDVLGRQVAVLVNEPQAPGTYQVTFDGTRLASGIYFYRLTAGAYVYSKKMTLLK
jgi:cyclomaltodextrinase